MDEEELKVVYRGPWETYRSSFADNIVTLSRRISFSRELEDEELEQFKETLLDEKKTPIEGLVEDINVLHLVDTNNYLFYVDVDLKELK